MNNRPTSEVLHLAADQIEERGWAKGNCGMVVEGPTCLEGALAAVIGTPVVTFDAGSTIAGDPTEGTPVYSYHPHLYEHPAYAVMQRHLELRYLYAWNDRAESATEVVEALRAAAVIEAARENETAEVVA